MVNSLTEPGVLSESGSELSPETKKRQRRLRQVFVQDDRGETAREGFAATRSILLVRFTQSEKVTQPSLSVELQRNCRFLLTHPTELDSHLKPCTVASAR